jgi:hypothetical protein
MMLNASFPVLIAPVSDEARQVRDPRIVAQLYPLSREHEKVTKPGKV